MTKFDLWDTLLFWIRGRCGRLRRIWKGVHKGDHSPGRLVFKHLSRPLPWQPPCRGLTSPEFKSSLSVFPDLSPHSRTRSQKKKKTNTVTRGQCGLSCHLATPATECLFKFTAYSTSTPLMCLRSSKPWLKYVSPATHKRDRHGHPDPQLQPCPAQAVSEHLESQSDVSFSLFQIYKYKSV